MRTIGLLILTLPVLVAGCGAGSAKGTAEGKVTGRAKMLDATAVTQKCDEAAKGHDRPFVVEWDATDLASFEARAVSDTVFVKYTGCKIEVLDRCSDNGFPGRFGNYGQPKWTSGTVQGFDISNEGELYAKLPLGAASLSGKVAAGETLHLKYFVSGVAVASREDISRADLAVLPGCKEATHFVSSYNLGAFELESSSHVEGEAEASGLGGSAGAKGKHKESQVGHGGDIRSCTTNSITACRVPIRLVLRKIVDADGPAVASTAATPPPGAGGPPPPPAGKPPTAAELNEKALVIKESSDAWMAGNDKLARQDGGCLKAMDRALKLNPSAYDFPTAKMTHARCAMVAGLCEQGAAEYRSSLVDMDPKKIKSDEELDRETRAASNRECPSSTAKNDADFILRASRELFSATYDAERQEAKPLDAKMCRAKYDAISSKMSKLDKTKPFEGDARRDGISAMNRAAECVSGAGKCSDGEPMFTAAYHLQLPGTSGVDKIAKEAWASRVKAKDKDKFLKTCKP